MKKSFNFLYLYFGLIWITAFALILWVTPHGFGVQPDSLVYFAGAKSILSGKGFFDNGSPITHFPPLYPFVLALMNLPVSNIVQAARILNAFLFGLNACLVALVVHWTTGRRYLTTTFAALFFLASAPLLSAHSWAMSEPLFITLSLVGIIFLARYVVEPSFLSLVVASLALGLGIIARYIGLAFLPIGLLVIFLGSKGQPLKRRIRDTIIYALIVSLPFMILSLRNLWVAGTASDRSFVYHPISEFHYVGGIIQIGARYVAPVSLPVWVWPAFLGLLAGLFISQLGSLSKLRFKDAQWRTLGIMIPLLCFLFSASFLLFLYLSLSFFDASTPVDIRILSPILAILILLVFSTMWDLKQVLKKPLLWPFFLLLVAISVFMKLPDAIRSNMASRRDGLGYMSLQWQKSETLAYVKSLKNKASIYSNGSDVLGFLTQSQSQLLPKKESPTTLLKNSNFDNEVDTMCTEINTGKAILVYFDTIARKYLPGQKEITSACKLAVLERFKDGIVYGEK